MLAFSDMGVMPLNGDEAVNGNINHNGDFAIKDISDLIADSPV